MSPQAFFAELIAWLEAVPAPGTRNAINFSFATNRAGAKTFSMYSSGQFETVKSGIFVSSSYATVLFSDRVAIENSLVPQPFDVGNAEIDTISIDTNKLTLTRLNESGAVIAEYGNFQIFAGGLALCTSDVPPEVLLLNLTQVNYVPI